MKNVKNLIKNNVLGLVVILVLITGGTVLAGNLIGDNNSEEQTTAVAIESTTASVVEETTTIAPIALAETVAPTITTTVVETQAPTQTVVVKALVAEVVTQEPTTVAYDPLKYFSYTLINGTYSLTKINYFDDIPMTLEVPSSYSGIAVTSIGSGVLTNIPIKTFVIPSSITVVESNLCGLGSLCPSLEKIVCKGTVPFKLGSFALNENQINGNCSIYISEGSIEAYKSEWNKTLYNAYDKLIKPLSQY